MARDPEKARERKRRYLERKKVEKYGPHHYVERGVDELGRFRPVDPEVAR